MTVDAEDIVRALAACPAPYGPAFGSRICDLCGAVGSAEHYDDCPWRAAKEWLTEHPESETSSPMSLADIRDWLDRFSW